MSKASPRAQPAASRLRPRGGHYVYLYKDNCGKVQYVGYGESPERATSHLAQTHNEKLGRFLASSGYRLLVSGPFECEVTGRAVETALISALEPECNVDPGPEVWRFRPLGVPNQFANRLVESQLDRHAFLRFQGRSPKPVLFVIVQNLDLGDDRAGYDPAQPPSDHQIRRRIDRWWQLRRFVWEWTAKPDRSPGLLVALHGSPGRQVVVASARIDRDAWREVEPQSGGKLRVPLVEPVDLDAHSLRGRRVTREARIAFGGIPSEFFAVLSVTGRLTGGRRRRA